MIKDASYVFPVHKLTSRLVDIVNYISAVLLQEKGNNKETGKKKNVKEDKERSSIKKETKRKIN